MTAKLLAGSKKSCGCIGRVQLKNYIGRRFGMLTVTGYAGKHNGMHRWNCVCDCGNETVVGQTLLQNGKTRSCGCLQAAALKENLRLCEGTSVTLLEAGKRRRLRTNTSGCTGVYCDKRTGHWIAQITFKHKTYYLGSYRTLEEATAARQRGEKMHDDFLEWYYQQHRPARAKEETA